MAVQADMERGRLKTSQPADTSCIHRGTEAIDWIECKTCNNGKTKAKIVACAVHGRCTEFTKPIEGIKACAGCVDTSATMKRQ